jgi:RNA polymerase sigma-70 factor (ECF subfamily)
VGDAPAAWSNADSVARLTAGGAEAAPAERELRRLLVAGLRRALGQRAPGDACEDFAQEALLRVRAQLPTFRGESRFTSWALSIAVRVAFDELRHQRWKNVSFDALTSDADGPVRFEPREEASQERRLARDQALAALQQALEGDLTDKQRRVLVAELSGMPHAEIALQLGMNRNALYKLAHDARKKLKGRLEAAGLSAEEVLWAFT